MDAGGELGSAGGQLKPVAEPGFSEDISGFRGISFNLLAKLVNNDVQVLHFVTIIWPPDGLEDFAMRDRDIRVCNQVMENLELLRGKPNVPPRDRHVAAS